MQGKGDLLIQKWVLQFYVGSVLTDFSEPCEISTNTINHKYKPYGLCDNKNLF